MYIKMYSSILGSAFLYSCNILSLIMTSRKDFRYYQIKLWKKIHCSLLDHFKMRNIYVFFLLLIFKELL